MACATSLGVGIRHVPSAAACYFFSIAYSGLMNNTIIASTKAVISTVEGGEKKKGKKKKKSIYLFPGVGVLKPPKTLLRQHPPQLSSVSASPSCSCRSQQACPYINHVVNSSDFRSRGIYKKIAFCYNAMV